jgi:hydroxymethylglutaryl-CoA reductase (NADPH)
MNLRDYPSSSERRAALEKERSISLDTVAAAQVNDEATIHCENMIGAISLPLGVAGPLPVKGSAFNGETYIPLATTEGALVASVNRGIKAMRESGGVSVSHFRSGTTRGPVFRTGGMEKSIDMSLWVDEHRKELSDIARKTSSHIELLEIELKPLAEYVFMRFSYDTDEAMGMNMVTIATEAVAKHIAEKTGAECLAVAGNYDIDKKPSWLNFIATRGTVVWAEAIIPGDVLERVLKTDAKRMFDVWLAKCMIGSAMAGSQGFNCQFANIVAAFFAATGQDLAHVVEGSHGIVTTNILKDRDLYVSVYMPAVMLGTVGGGTKLATQTEARSVTGAQTVGELAEVLAGAVLAGEISLLASLSKNTLGSSHTSLGR